MENYENVLNAGSAASPAGSRPEDTGLLGSRPATPLGNPDYSNLLMNLNQRLLNLEGVGTAVQPMHVSLNVALPERYNGNVARCRDFLLAVDNLFAIQPHRYPTHEIKTRFIGTLLTHEALAWFRDVLERKADLLMDYSQFVREFRAFFDDPNAQRHAADALGRLKQLKGSCLTYATKFRRLAHETGFNNGALVNFFRKGLSEEIKDRLANALEEPEELEDLISLCVKIDQRLYDRRIEKGGNVNSQSTQPRFPPRQPNGPAPMDLDSAQPKKFTKLTAEERKRRFDEGLCLYCGDKTHKLASCPARNAKMGKGPGLNMLTLSALDSFETISVKSIVRLDDLDIELDSMVDSGATGCFVSQDWVDKSHLPTTALDQELAVRLANGLEVICEEVLLDVSIGLADMDTEGSVKLDMIVLPGLKFDGVLGLPWLSRANPDIDWSSRTLTLKRTKGVSFFKERSSNQTLHNLTVSQKKVTFKDPVTMEPGDFSQKECSSNGSLRNLNVRKSVDDTSMEPEKSIQSYTGCLPPCHTEFEEVCHEKEPGILPPLRPGIDLEINLKDDTLQPPFLRIYPLSDFEEEELRKWIDNNLQKGFIVPSNSSYAAPIFFVKKKNGKLRPCIDYRKLNDNTVRDGHPIPLVSDVLSKFKDSKVFSSIDLHGAYNLVRVKPGDELRASFRCKYGQFEPRVIQFGLTNAPAAFMRFVVCIFRDLIDVYLEVYLDDIIIYSKTLEDHTTHLREVFRRLSIHQLVVSLEKCSFFTTELVYLGYRITIHGIAMEDIKVKAILEYGAPRNVTEVRSFLGMANFYRKFIAGFSSIVTPLTVLTRKGVEFKWTEDENVSFLKLKDAFRNDVLLKYPDTTQAFTLFCDASDQALGAVLSQRDSEENFRPVEFYSRKFVPAELNYTVYDKELLAIVE